MTGTDHKSWGVRLSCTSSNPGQTTPGQMLDSPCEFRIMKGDR